MAYTVKKFSELSGVTVRTLHFYEEEGLLAPAYYGSNGYRYYEEKELLQLQQILFFKELGFTIKQIKKILGRSDFDRLAALYSHKQALSREWDKLGQLLKTVDNTIKHLKGSKKMDDKKFFDGFGLVTKAKGSESYFAAEALVIKSVRNPTGGTKDKSYYDEINKTASEIFREITHYLEKDLDPTSNEVQSSIKKHHAFTNKIHDATKEVYEALAQLYREHPEFKKQLDFFHSKLPEFLSAGMLCFSTGAL